MTTAQSYFRSPAEQVHVAGARREPRPRPLARLAFFFLWCFIFTIPWENVVVLPQIGTLAHLIGYITFGIGILALLDTGRLRASSTTWMLIVLFAFWRTASYFWTAAPDLTLIEIQTVWQMVAMVWLLEQLANTRQLQISIVRAYVLGTFVSSIDTVWQYLNGGNAGSSRFWAPGFDPNELALMLVLSIPLSLYLGILAKRSPMVWLYRLHVALTASAVLLTASRGPFLASLGALFFIPASFAKWTRRQKSALFFVVAAGIVAAAWIVPPSSWKRLESIQGEITNGTLNDRKLIWKAGYEIFREHPVLGVGAGAFLVVVRHSMGYSFVAHNTFLSIAVEQGLIGFGIFLILLLDASSSALRMPPLERGLWLAVLLAMMIGIFSLTWEYRKPMWLFFGLIALQAAELKRRSPAKCIPVLTSVRQPPCPTGSFVPGISALPQRLPLRPRPLKTD